MTFLKSSIDAWFKSFYTCIIIILYTSLYSLPKSTQFYERPLPLLFSIYKGVELYFSSIYLKEVDKTLGGEGRLMHHNELRRANQLFWSFKTSHVSILIDECFYKLKRRTLRVCRLIVMILYFTQILPTFNDIGFST